LYAEDIAVVPGNPQSIAVSLKRLSVSPRHGGVAIYDNGVRRALMTGDHTGSNSIEYSASPSVLYGYNNETTEFGFRKMIAGSCGVKVFDVKQSLFGGFGADFKIDNGLVYTNGGRVIDAETGSLVGTFTKPDDSSGYASGFTVFSPDSATGRVYFLSGENSNITLYAYDMRTFLLVGALRLPSTIGAPSSLVRWGSNGLAFRTSANKVYLLQTSLVPENSTPVSPAPVPATPGYSVSGRVANYSQGSISGVAIKMSGSRTDTVQTDASGNFSITKLDMCGTYTLKPSKVGYAFSPSQVEFTPGSTYNPSNGTQVYNFDAYPATQSIAGRVTNSSGGGVSGITINVSGSQSATTQTNASGYYTLVVPREGDYTVTAVSDAFGFAPPSHSFSALVTNVVANFTTTPPLAIRGQVVDVHGLPTSGVTMTLSGARVTTTVTDDAGNFSFTNLLSNRTYSVAPTLMNHSFNPPAHTYAGISAEQFAAFESTPTAGETVLLPIADSYVKGSAATADTNFGAADELQVKRAYTPGSGRGRQAYLRFDTSSVTGTLARATLRVYGRLNAITPANTNIQCAVFPASNALWTETGLTWNNKFAPDVPRELSRVVVTDDTERWYEFDVTAFVNSERAAGRMTTGILLRNMLRGEIGDYYTVFRSKEAPSNQPQLVLSH
jgi:hypothetical protein